MKFAKAMKGDGGAESTKTTNYRKGSTTGITPSVTMVSPVTTKGNTAKFSNGKKSVSK